MDHNSLDVSGLQCMTLDPEEHPKRVCKEQPEVGNVEWKVSNEWSAQSNAALVSLRLSCVQESNGSSFNRGVGVKASQE